MKKTIFLIFIISFVAIANAQIEFAPVGAEWNYTNKETINGNMLQYKNLNYICEKDTIVQSNNCKLIRGSEVSSYGNSSIPGNYAEIIYQDNSTIYYFFDGQFRKLFDFSLELEDSIDIEFKTYKVNSYNMDSTIVIRCIVDEILFDTINGTEVKTFRVMLDNFSFYHPDITLYDLKSRYFFNELYLHYNINYIGDFIPHVSPYPTICMELPVYNLTCYNDDNVNYVTDWWLEEDKPCDFSGTISVVNTENQEIKFFPNPVLENITIQNSENDINLVEIADLLGKVHVSLSTETNSDICIDLRKLTKGIYFLKISDNKNNLRTTKIIKL